MIKALAGLFVAVTLTTSTVAPARARCGDFGGLGVIIVAGTSELGVLVTALIGAAIARVNDEGAGFG